MSPRKSHKVVSRRHAILGPLVSSARAPILLILANSIIFYLSLTGKVNLEEWILYPGNLLAGRVWTVITSGFIHHHGMHLGLNMLGLFVFGRVVERHLGFLKTLFIYFGALIVSMFFSTIIYAFILHKNVAIIGASGAVMGLLGAAMLLDPFCITYEMILPLPIMIKAWLFLFADIKGFLGGENDGTSHLAHLCGFISIAFLVYFLSAKDKRMIHAGLMVNIFSFMVFLFLRKWFLNLPLP